MLTLLAGSLFNDRGYNVLQPGTTSDSDTHDFKRDEEAVAYYRIYMSENLEESIRVTKRRTQSLRFIHEMNELLEEGECALNVLQEFAIEARDADRAFNSSLEELEDFSALNKAVKEFESACEQITTMQILTDQLIDLLQPADLSKPDQADTPPPPAPSV